MNRQMKRIVYHLLLFSTLVTSALQAQSVAPSTEALQASMADTDSIAYSSSASQHLLRGTLNAAPLIGIGLIQTLHNKQVRTIRHEYTPHFRHHFDDYLQFAPLATQLGLRLSGVEGRSKSVWEAATADVVATATMLAITSAIKYTARVQRPDGSARNSFPSGHTAMAFTSAALLSMEYGDRYPWLTPASYGLASLTGLGRISIIGIG